MFRQVAGMDDFGWLDKGFGRRIEFQDGIGHELDLIFPYGIRKISWAFIGEMLIECLRKFMVARAVTLCTEVKIIRLCRGRQSSVRHPGPGWRSAWAEDPC